MQSFLVLFYLLDRCYAVCPEDHLGAFLGMISPELWEGGRPMDQAIYDDWKTLKRENRDRSRIVRAVYSFLEEYEAKYGFCFPKTKERLLRIADENTLERAYSYADERNSIFKYPDFEL